MADSHEFSLEDIEPKAADAAGTPAPVVVVHYRGAWWSSLFVPPALILCAAVLGLVYRVQLADWTGIRLPTFRTAARPAWPSPAAQPPVSPAPEASLPKLVINVRPELPPVPAPPPDAFTELSLAGPLPDVTLRKRKAQAESDKAGPIGFDLPATDTDAGAPVAVGASIAATPPPEAPAQDNDALTAQALDEIHEQAEFAKLERAALENVKEHGLELERRRLIQQHREKMERVRREADASRNNFLRTLQSLLKRTDRRAGLEIHRLMQEEIAGIDPTVSEPLSTAMEGLPYQGDITRRIQQLRRQSVPEALILKFAWKNEIKNIPARKGPRDEAEAMVFAARRLIKASAPTNRRGDVSPPAATSRASTRPVTDGHRVAQ